MLDAEVVTALIRLAAVVAAAAAAAVPVLGSSPGCAVP